jgi:class 3 adenylate cyclase
VGGIAVNLASRVLGRAESGQVPVSRTIVDLVAGTGIKFEDCGHHVLKGVEDSWRLFAVVDT